jgi:hypothetical protein
VEGDRSTTAFEEKILGKWKLISSPYSGYWEFSSTVVDSLCTRTKTVRELDIHIPGFCAGKGYWSLTNDSILDNSCIPMAHITKLTNDSLDFKFRGGWVEIEYKWKR